MTSCLMSLHHFQRPVKYLTMKNIIIQKESKTGVRQWHFDRIQVLTSACIALIVVGVSLFFVSDQLSHYLYEKRLKEFKTNYVNVQKNLDSLKSKLNYLDSQINKIEEKDNAIRTYAGMPIIDKDIRKLGIGGHLADAAKFSDNLAPIINKELRLPVEQPVTGGKSGISLRTVIFWICLTSGMSLLLLGGGSKVGQH